MGRVKKTKKFALVKRMLNPKDTRLTENLKKSEDLQLKKSEPQTRHVEQLPSSMFFKHNSALGPPYHVILDTNFINISIQNKLDISKSLIDCLYAKCFVYVSECVIGEIEKLGPKYRLALRLARDPRFERLPCMHSGTYADDCIVNRVSQHKCYIVATCDKELKRRIRKIPGIPIISVGNHKYTVEQLAEYY